MRKDAQSLDVQRGSAPTGNSQPVDVNIGRMELVVKPVSNGFAIDCRTDSVAVSRWRMATLCDTLYNRVES